MLSLHSLTIWLHSFLQIIFSCQSFVQEDFGYFKFAFRCFKAWTETVASAREDAFILHLPSIYFVHEPMPRIEAHMGRVVFGMGGL